MESKMNNAQQDDADQGDAGPRTKTATPKIRRWKKFAVLALALLVSVWLGWNWRLATQGYCFEEGRFLSDREFLERGMSGSYDILGYPKAEPEWKAYMSSHPECCSIERRSFLIPFSGQTGGWGLYDVYVVIQPLPQGRSGNVAQFEMTSCRRVATEYIGG